MLLENQWRWTLRAAWRYCVWRGRYQRPCGGVPCAALYAFYNAIKRIIEDGRIGEVVTIQAMEQVGYWHQAHSYVRGNWRRADESSPMILAKCCQ